MKATCSETYWVAENERGKLVLDVGYGAPILAKSKSALLKEFHGSGVRIICKEVRLVFVKETQKSASQS